MTWQVITRLPNGAEHRTTPSDNLVGVRFALLMNELNFPSGTHWIDPPLPEGTPELTPSEFMQYGINVLAAQCQAIFQTKVQATQAQFDLWTQIPIAPKSSDQAVLRLQSCTMDEIHTTLVVFDLENMARVMVAMDRIITAFDGKVLTPGGEQE